MEQETGLVEKEQEIAGATPFGIFLRDELRELDAEPLAVSHADGVTYSVMTGESTLWVLAERAAGAGVAFCLAWTPRPTLNVLEQRDTGDGLNLRLCSSLGEYLITIELPNASRRHLHWTTRLCPAIDILLPAWPRDVYPLGPERDPFLSRGVVHAHQRGPKGALLFATTTRPASGSFLYVQNLTALNELFEITQTSGSGVIGSGWPELGFALPVITGKPLPAGREITLSDAFVCFSDAVPVDDIEEAKLFLDLYADLYLVLPKPEAQHRHWPRRVNETIRDLTHSPECTCIVDEQRYLNAYVGSADIPPESMVQLAVLLPMIEYQQWKGMKIPLVEDLKKNIPTFFDEKVGTLVRWLPSLPYEKSSEMDSWYLYHTLLNMVRLAKYGDPEIRRLFLRSLDYAIKVARHFNYRWPIFYNPATLEVQRAESAPGRGGENDVGGLYAHVLLQAHELTGDAQYLDEARKALMSMKGLGFRLAYQLNNTAYGAKAALLYWRQTGEDIFRDLSYVCIANVMHNVWLWECDYGHARHYRTFMGLPPLHDGFYLALYEELEVLAAFHEYLQIAENDVSDSVRILLPEYCKYLLDRAWHHYPSELPVDVLSEETKSGRLNRDLSVPLEDLYDGWGKAGQVGQEIYGASLPFIISTRHTLRVPGTEFLISCSYPVDIMHPDRVTTALNKGDTKVVFTIRGHERCTCHVRISSEDSSPLPAFRIHRVDAQGKKREEKWRVSCEGYLECSLPGNAKVIIDWKAMEQPQNGHTRKGRGKGSKAEATHQSTDTKRNGRPRTRRLQR